MYGGVGMIAFWSLIVGLVVWAVRRPNAGSNTPSQRVDQPTPLEVLQRRYAGGEISREEYAKIREDLRQS